MVTAEAYHMFEMFYSREKSISKKKMRYLARNAINVTTPSYPNNALLFI